MRHRRFRGSGRKLKTFDANIRSSESFAWPRVEDLGERAPDCWGALWAALENLYLYATCASGCPGGDHTPRYIAGRVVNLTVASLRNAENGWYDTPLLAARVIHEHANVLALISLDKEAMQVYKAGTWRERRDTLSPRRVRRALAERGVSTALSDTHVAHLSERLVHPPFEAIITAHTPGVLVVGPLWQPGGFILAINELAVATLVFIVRLAASATDLAGEERAALVTAARAFKQGIGGLTIDHIPPDMRHRVPDDLWE